MFQKHLKRMSEINCADHIHSPSQRVVPPSVRSETKTHVTYSWCLLDKSPWSLFIPRTVHVHIPHHRGLLRSSLRPCAGSSQSRKGSKTQYTISGGSTSQSGKCPEQDTKCCAVTEHHGAASGRSTGKGTRLRLGLPGGKSFGRRASLAERGPSAEPTGHGKRVATGSIWGQPSMAGRWTATDIKLRRCELGALVKQPLQITSQEEG